MIQSHWTLEAGTTHTHTQSNANDFHEFSRWRFVYLCIRREKVQSQRDYYCTCIRYGGWRPRKSEQKVEIQNHIHHTFTTAHIEPNDASRYLAATNAIDAYIRAILSLSWCGIHDHRSFVTITITFKLNGFAIHLSQFHRNNCGCIES